MCSKENILGCLSNRNRGKAITLFQCLAVTWGYLLDNDCYASLAVVLTEI